jgi:phospholipid transport system substrate-binding protein
MTLHNRAVATLLAVLIVLVARSAGAEFLAPPTQTPDALMNAVTSEILATLREDLAAGRPSAVADIVESKILPLFDFQRMTRTAAGRSWSAASPEQQAALVTEFRTLLVRTYSGALSGYRDQEVRYRPLRAAAGETEVLVRSTVKRPGAQALEIDYDMEDRPAGWKVFDVRIAGVSLVLNYRESFAAAVRSGGIDGLLKSLSDKNRLDAPAHVQQVPEH